MKVRLLTTEAYLRLRSLTANMNRPYFYDEETDVAKRNHEIQELYANSMIEDADLLRNIQLKAIQKSITNIQQNNNCDNDGLPITPDCSDDDDNNTNDHNNVEFGEIKYWNHDDWNKDKNAFDMYCIDGIFKQMMMAPKNKYLDGNDLMKNAQITNEQKNKKRRDSKNKKMINIQENTRRKRRRRGGKKNNKKNKKYLDQRNEDEIKCGKLVSYIEYAKKQKKI